MFRLEGKATRTCNYSAARLWNWTLYLLDFTFLFLSVLSVYFFPNKLCVFPVFFLQPYSTTDKLDSGL